MGKIKNLLKLMRVSISPRNTKMGDVPSVSLPAIWSCPRDCKCYEICYALRMAKFRANTKDSYERNWKILLKDPYEYWRQVKGAVLASRFFRFHVSGDIPNPEYLVKMVETAVENPHCTLLCFTKRYGFVNDFVRNGGVIPENLVIIFSAWRGYPMDNPYNFPEAHVRWKDGTTDAREGAIECHGTCFDCYVAGCGCWKMKHGDQLILDQH